MLESLFKDSGCPRGSVGKLILSMMNRGHRELHEWALSLVEIAPRARALDIGCGGGSAMALMLRRCRDGKVCGIDVSKCGLECSARRNANAIAAGRCEVRAGSAEAVPYPDCWFDLVTAFETLYFWSDVDDGFAEALRVLRPGGTFLIANNQSDPASARWTDVVDRMTVYGEDDITARLARAGFAAIKVHYDDDGAICVTAKKPETRRRA
ncbi:class I SAM-dependent methyltransferase [Cloacibacillus sp. An23]|uniref:class I SAM-dependent methyltransferase n=1 Tax=Cloacibacillus sp. An23 TaxID=1965591 RepID=UPI000B38502E|nr:class I SAM-dependent methyltransferase [Cloacibacillus sp. An23]OUO92825.1 hypothetical protein B5F39_10155 [Cloacibacillus sp. An23]